MIDYGVITIKLRVPWLIGGVVVTLPELYLSSLLVSVEYGWTNTGSQVASMLFFASILHFLASVVLSRPSRKSYHATRNDNERRDPFVGLDGYELADQGYGIDVEKSAMYRMQALSFAVPGVLLFVGSVIVGLV
jgi:hypothetical protein